MPYWTSDEETAIVRVASDRIGADFQRTVGRSLELRLNETDEGYPPVLVYLDGGLDGAIVWPEGETVEESVAGLADLLQEHTLHEGVWGGWPTCPRHHSHPLVPRTHADHAAWWCATDDVLVAPIGDLSEIG